MNNLIDNQVFQNHDTYVYYTIPLLKSEHKINVPPVSNDTDIVNYSSFETVLYVNGIESGNWKVNRFSRNMSITDTSTQTFIGTIITPKGCLVINYATQIISNTNLYVIGQNLSTYAVYKSGEYSKYINVRVDIDVSNNHYRVMTISY